MTTVYFLEASVPLTKTFKQVSKRGDIEKEAYPLVGNFTSHEVEVKNTMELYKAIALHADKGHCLLKGELSRPLSQESRRGTTKTNDRTSWVCLDFDRHNAESVDAALERLGLGDVSYVLQWSASHGLKEHEGTLSAHVFMMLDSEVPAPELKAWLMDLNLKHLRDDIRLARAKSVLSWPLDITTCQNDKLIYIAPPKFIGMKDPLKQRIELVMRKRPAIKVGELDIPHINALKTQEREALNKLRKAEGLPTRTAKTAWVGNIEVQSKPDECVVTEIRYDGEFVRLNLNGGDSWAYWHPKDNFELIHDFKSDTWYRTKDLVPGYYQELLDERMALNATPTEDGDLILAFRDLRTAAYYNGLWNPGENKLELHQARNETQLEHWMRSHGRVIGDFIPVWDICFDPHDDWVVDEAEHKINTFRPSPYFSVEPNAKGQFPVIEGVIMHLLGVRDPKDPLYQHFLNWLAVIFQRKAKPLTAWVTHGVEGCLAGDTEICFRRGKRIAGRPLTIKDAYEKFNGLWSAKGANHKGKGWDRSLTTYASSVKDDFTIGYHEVYRIVESGVKMLYRVVTNDGGLIRVTHEHPFMRPDGTMTKLCDLKVGDIVLKRGKKNAHVKTPKGRNKNRATIHSIPYHPYAWQHIINGKNYKRLHRARLVWEAALNDMTLDEFVWVLRNDPVQAGGLKYLDQSIIVHHLDEDPSNDALSNLTTVDKLNHDQHHAKETGLGTVLTREAKIISITEDREEMTYDMTMKAPYHNYVANDFCVSNTGKGTLFTRILQPLLNHTNVFAGRIDNLEEQFNGWMQGKLLVLIDEIDVDDFRERGRVASKLRNYITEPMVSFRHMRQAAVFDKNYASFIFASNRPQPVFIPESDRRYNCGNFQKAKLVYPGDEAIENELEAFAAFLLAHKADIEAANRVMETEDRARIQRLGITSLMETCRVVLEGRFEDLWYAMPDERLMAEAGIVNSHTQNAQAYCMLMRRIAADILAGKGRGTLSRDELLVILQYNVGNMPVTPNKFTSLLRHNGIETKQLRHNGTKTMGVNVDWVASEDLLADLGEALSQKKALMRRVK
jgi:hypothetical protein